MEIDIGISKKDRKNIADGLSKLLADTYTLYLKTHNFHWNVEGPMFNTLHLMFETQYNELALAVDAIAERIRALGHPAPGSYAAYAKLSSIKEETGDAQGRGHDPAAGRRPGSGRPHGARGVPLGREGRRRADRGPADPAPADP